MNWSKDKSLLLSRVCVAVFALLLAALDVGCYWLARWFALKYLGWYWQYIAFLMVTVYLCSVLGWILLWKLWGLLAAIRRGEVFSEANVARLRAVSWCCFGAAAVCLVSWAAACLLSCLYYFPFVIVAAAAAFVGLIVRIVKNVFRQALDMKAELDLTI